MLRTVELSAKSERFVVRTGSVISLLLAAFVCYLLFLGLQNLALHSASSVILICTILGSPVILVFQLLAVVMAMSSEQPRPKRYAAGAINFFGALVAFYFAILLIGFMRIGPINPC